MFYKTMRNIDIRTVHLTIMGTKRKAASGDEESTREDGDDVVDMCLSNATRYNYETKLKRLQQWLKKEHPQQVNGTEIILPLSPSICKQYLAYESVKRDANGVEISPPEFKAFPSIGACKSALVYLYKKSGFKISHELDTMLKGTIIIC